MLNMNIKNYPKIWLIYRCIKLNSLHSMRCRDVCKFARFTNDGSDVISCLCCMDVAGTDVTVDGCHCASDVECMHLCVCPSRLEREREFLWWDWRWRVHDAWFAIKKIMSLAPILDDNLPFFFVARQEPRGALIAFQEHILHHLELLPQILAMTVMLANYKPALVWSVHQIAPLAGQGHILPKVLSSLELKHT